MEIKDIIENEEKLDEIFDQNDKMGVPLPHNRVSPTLSDTNLPPKSYICPIHRVSIRAGKECPLCEERKKLDTIPEELKTHRTWGGKKPIYTLEEKKQRQKEASRRWRDRNRDKALESQRLSRKKERIRKGYHYQDTIGLKIK